MRTRWLVYAGAVALLSAGAAIGEAQPQQRPQQGQQTQEQQRQQQREIDQQRRQQQRELDQQRTQQQRELDEQRIQQQRELDQQRQLRQQQQQQPGAAPQPGLQQQAPGGATAAIVPEAFGQDVQICPANPRDVQVRVRSIPAGIALEVNARSDQVAALRDQIVTQLQQAAQEYEQAEDLAMEQSIETQPLAPEEDPLAGLEAEELEPGVTRARVTPAAPRDLTTVHLSNVRFVPTDRGGRLIMQVENARDLGLLRREVRQNMQQLARGECLKIFPERVSTAI